MIPKSLRLSQTFLAHCVSVPILALIVSPPLPKIYSINRSSLSILLNLSHNSFIGKLPFEVGNLKNINQLDISENNFYKKKKKRSLATNKGTSQISDTSYNYIGKNGYNIINK